MQYLPEIISRFNTWTWTYICTLFFEAPDCWQFAMIGTWFLAKILTSTPGKKIATRLMFFDVLNIKWTWKKKLVCMKLSQVLIKRCSLSRIKCLSRVFSYMFRLPSERRRLWLSTTSYALQLSAMFRFLLSFPVPVPSFVRLVFRNFRLYLLL